MPEPSNHQWLVVDSGPNPSTDYFVKPFLKSQGINARFINWKAELPEVSQNKIYSVVFVRYLSHEWQSWVTRNRAQIKHLAYFMDDDLFDTTAWKGQRWGYQWRLYTKAYRFKQWLGRQGAQLWVSTPVLAEKYAAWPVTQLRPESPYQAGAGNQQAENTSQKKARTGPPSIFYHGSASHEAELLWLRPVLETVLEEHPHVEVELIADQRLGKHYASLQSRFGERLHLVPPMNWLEYQQFIQKPGRTLGLAPLLDKPFNAARAPTKVYDIAAAGAFGLFADNSIYRPLLAQLGGGRLLPMEQDIWVEAMLDGLTDA